ncbi:MAG: GNAT family N-acetyltransferase [Candidatus Azobacteroides sp.]|nr:GNAT family N-acetyltransferase [Candidatus Azobacteroides sp.]
MTDNVYTITPVGEEEYHKIVSIWEISVRETHSFLKEDDLLFYKKQIPRLYLPNLTIYGLRDEQGTLKGFIGTSGNKLEMLFLHPATTGKGFGRILIEYAISRLKIDEVDVNEQNTNATGFYKRFGFKVISRSEQDGEGKDYPILHMKL